MALTDTSLAIGGVSRLLSAVLTNALSSVPPYNPGVTISRPQPGNGGGGAQDARINLFLYEVQIDGSMRNIPVTPGRNAPLWMVLKYLLTTFDNSGESDSDAAHDVLGLAMQVLLSINDADLLQPSAGSLIDNPEPLKVTFDHASPELLSRLMQGPDDKYRCSAAFQVRPVLIAAGEPPSSMELVGVQYPSGTKIGLAGVHTFVLPNLGPELLSLDLSKVEPGETLTLTGNNLGLPGLTIQIGPVQLDASMQQPSRMQCVVDGPMLDPTVVSAGSLALTVKQTLAAGLTVSSNVLPVSLLPKLTSVTPLGLALANQKVFGTIDVAGRLLGTKKDYIELALIGNGTVVLLLDRPDPAFTPPADQSAQRFRMVAEQGVSLGVYAATMRVNGQQSKQAFPISMVA